MRRSFLLLSLALLALMAVTASAGRISRQAALEPMQAQHAGEEGEPATILLQSEAAALAGNPSKPSKAGKAAKATATAKPKKLVAASVKNPKKATKLATQKTAIASAVSAAVSDSSVGYLVNLDELNKVFEALNVKVGPKPVPDGDLNIAKPRSVSRGANAKLAKARALVAISSRVESGLAPVATVGLEPAGLPATRVALRGGPDPAGFIGKFIYRTEPKTGRVISASGPVQVKPRGILSDASYLICDRMYFQEKKIARNRTLWQTGHIMGSTLGGDDKDPLNFFPQHGKSNSAGGVWWRTELLAGAGARLFTYHKLIDAATKATCVVTITAKFNYPSATSVMAIGGTYEVAAPDSCLAAALKKGKVSEITYSDVFLALLSTQKALVGTTRKVTIAWKNDVDPSDGNLVPI